MCWLRLLLCAWPGEALQLVGTVVDMECCHLTADVFRTILLAGSPAAAGTAQVRAQLHRPGYCSHTPFQQMPVGCALCMLCSLGASSSVLPCALQAHHCTQNAV